MALVAAPLLCPFIVMFDIFMLKKDTTKTHCNNAKLNVPDTTPVSVYHAALAGHSLVMGLKTNSSSVDAQLSKMEATIENIASLAAVGNLAVNQLMGHEATTVVTTRVASIEEPKWTIMITKNVRQVVNRAMETLADMPKQEECKLNLCITSFEAKEGETEKELVQWFNTKLL
jgi:hypothetical protein